MFSSKWNGTQVFRCVSLRMKLFSLAKSGIKTKQQFNGSNISYYRTLSRDSTLKIFLEVSVSRTTGLKILVFDPSSTKASKPRAIRGRNRNLFKKKLRVLI